MFNRLLFVLSFIVLLKITTPIISSRYCVSKVSVSGPKKWKAVVQSLSDN